MEVLGDHPVSPAVAIVSIAYLIAEVSFNARLLDLMVGVPSQCELDGIELFGRVLSGIGLGMLVWKASARFHQLRLTALLGLCLCTIPLAYRLQSELVRYLVDHSSGLERRAADAMLLLARSVASNRAEIAGLEEVFQLHERASGKTFLALLPVFGLGSLALQKGLDQGLPSLADNMVRGSLGDSKRYYNETYVNLRDRYVKFYRGAYSNAAGAAVAVEENPELKQTKRGAKAIDDYNRLVHEFLGPNAKVPPGLPWPQFIARPEVYLKFTAQLAQPIDPQCKLNFDWDEETHRRCAFDYAIRTKTDELTTKLRGDIAAYGDGGRYEREGRERYQAVVVPAIALCLSLCFGTLNFLVLAAEFLKAGFRAANHPAISRSIVGSAVALLVIVPWMIPNPLTSLEQYHRLMKGLRADASWASLPGVVAVDWAMHAEPLAYPAMSWVRTHALFGVTFTRPGCSAPPQPAAPGAGK